MNYTQDQSSSFGDAPPRPTPTPAAAPTSLPPGATYIKQINYTRDQSSSFGDAPPRPTPTPAAGPTANSLKHIDSKCLIGNWLCSVKKLSRRNPPSSNSAILIDRK